MNKTENRVVALGLAVMLSMSSGAFAAETTTTPTVPGTTPTVPGTSAAIRIQYSQALELMMTKNKEILALEGDLKVQEDAIKEADTNKKRYSNIIMNDPDKSFERGKIVYVTPIKEANRKKELQRTLADKKIELNEKLLKYYVDWKTINMELQLNNEVLNIQTKEHALKTAQHKLGKITFKELSKSTVGLEIAKKDTDKLKRKIDLLLLDFNVLITNGFSLTYTFADDTIQNLLKVPNVQMSAEELQAIAVNNVKKDSELAKLQDALLEIEETKRVERLYSSSVDYLVTYDKSIKSNKEAAANRQLAVEYQVYNDYYTIKSLMTDVESADENIKLAQMKYELNQALLKSGNLTDLDLVKSKKDLQEAEHKKLMALYELYKVYTVFIKNSI